MENLEKQNISKTEAFLQSEIVVPFIDGNFIMKLAGENKWYIVNEHGDVVVRTKSDGDVEFSEVDLSLETGELTHAEFGDFVGATMMVELVGESDGKNIVDHIMISPSGYTKRIGDSFYELRDGLNDPRTFWVATHISKNPRRFVNFKASDLNSLGELDFYFDIAQYFLVKQFDEHEQARKEFLESGALKTNQGEVDYRRGLVKIDTSARQIKKRYDELQILIPRRLERQKAQEAARAAARQAKIDNKSNDYDELRAKAQESINAMFGLSNQ